MEKYWSWKAVCVYAVICVIIGVTIGAILNAHNFGWSPDMGLYKFIKFTEWYDESTVRYCIPCDCMTHLNVLDIIRMW